MSQVVIKPMELANTELAPFPSRQAAPNGSSTFSGGPNTKNDSVFNNFKFINNSKLLPMPQVIGNEKNNNSSAQPGGAAVTGPEAVRTSDNNLF